MGLLVGSPSFLRTPHSSFPFSNPLSSSVRSSQRKAARTRSLLATCCANRESHVGAVVTPPRRALLLAGISALPFLTLGAMAADVVVVQDKQDVKEPYDQDVIITEKQDDIKPEIQDLQDSALQDSSQEPNQFEQANLQNAPANSSISLQNGVGIIVSGVLGALYATSQKEKTATKSTLESECL